MKAPGLGVVAAALPQDALRRKVLAGGSAAILLTLLGCDSGPKGSALAPGSVVLAFGDSLTHGTGAGPGQDWPTLLAAATGWRIVNAGVPGDTAAAAQERLAGLLAQHRPALVIIGLGGNDFLRRRRHGDVKQDLAALVERSRESGARVVLMAIPAPSLLAAVASTLQDAPLYEELAEEKGVPLIADIVSEVLSDNGLKADPIHPNARGYRLMAEAIHKELRSLGFVNR